MNKSTKGLIILFTPFVLGFLLGFILGGGFGHKDKAEKEVSVEQIITESAKPEAQAINVEETEVELKDESDGGDGAKEIIYYGPRLAYSRLFADLNEKHIEVAQRVGLSSIPQTRSDVEGMKKELVKIEDNDYYIVDELRYSMPYLTPGAAKELMTIAKAFSDSLKRKELLDYKLIVSSVLRTEEDVTRLRKRGNPNASNNSAHCYGTTFDITYVRYHSEDETEAFMQPYELTKVLGEVLRDQKNATRCLVKYERSEHCFHITSTIK